MEIYSIPIDWTDATENLFTTGAGTFSNIIATRFYADNLYLEDPFATDYDIIIAATGPITADRSLTFSIGNANRSITLEGNPTLDGQDYTTTGSPAFADLDLTGTLTVDTINEHTATAGVTIDSVVLKDNTVTAEQLTSTDDITMAGYLLNTMGATDAKGMYLDGSTNAYTGTSTNYGIDNYKIVSTPAGTGNLVSYAAKNRLTNNYVLNGAPFSAGTENYGMSNEIVITAAHSADPTLTITEKNYGLSNTINRSGILTCADMTVSNYGIWNSITDSISFDNAGETLTINNYGGYFYIIQTGTETAGTLVKNNYGVYVEVLGNTQGTTTNYGVYIGQVTGADTNWGIYQADADLNSAINYRLKVGGVTAPVCTLDVTGAISSATSTFSTEGPTDNVDVSGINTLFIDTSGNNVTIGGFVGGVNGQELRVVVIDATNDTILEHAEGTGNQDIYLHAGIDETLDGHYGGWNLVCNGTHWYDESHAKHV